MITHRAWKVTNHLGRVTKVCEAWYLFGFIRIYYKEVCL